ncbi:MAG: ComEC/Rec2 family competence protein, partial [Phycisphaerales bacterium]|nr:ComEC/Rec2 family competence protein [Phycisphaerales bacterium]
CHGTDPVQHTLTVSITALRIGDAWINASGRLRVVLPENTSQVLRAGEMVTLLGSFRPPRGPRNPGEPDWLSLAAQSNRVGSIYIESDELVVVSSPLTFRQRSLGVFWRIRAQLRSRAIRVLGVESSDSQSNAVLGALILGVRDPGFNEVYQSFQRVGIAHMLAISGFHVAVMLWLAVMGVRVIGEHPKLETLVVLGIIISILLLLPLRPPIIRAVLIVLILLGAGGSGRRYDRLTMLAWIGSILLLVRPLDLFSLGFQLSFGITAMLLALPKPNQENQAHFLQSKHRGFFASSITPIWKLFRINTACWLIATPTIMHSVGIVSILAPIAALVMIPVVVVLMIAGYTQLGVGMVSPALADTLSPITGFISQQATHFTIQLDSIPGSSVRAPNLGIAWTLFATVLLSVFILRPRMRTRWKTSGACVLMGGWATILIVSSHHANTLRIDMLDVGNGSCFIIRSVNESTLFDLGSLDHRVENTVSRSAHALQARPIQSAFISHDNLDHFNGLVNSTINLGLRRIYITEAISHDPSRAWISIRESLIESGAQLVVVHAGDTISLGDSTAEILWPPKGFGADSINNENNTSLVVRWSIDLHGQERSILMTGDIEAETMRELMARHPDLHADILEIPHHGSPHATLIEFVNHVNPSVVLQSTGRSRLNDPRLDPLRLLSRSWYTTADRGAAWARVQQDGTIESGWSVD